MVQASRARLGLVLLSVLITTWPDHAYTTQATFYERIIRNIATMFSVSELKFLLPLQVHQSNTLALLGDATVAHLNYSQGSVGSKVQKYGTRETPWICVPHICVGLVGLRL